MELPSLRCYRKIVTSQVVVLDTQSTHSASFMVPPSLFIHDQHVLTSRSVFLAENILFKILFRNS